MFRFLTISASILVLNFSLGLPWGNAAEPVTSSEVGNPASAIRTIEIVAVQKEGKTHWTPEKVEVTPGEKVKFVVKHELEGGFDFHGFALRELKILKQVNRGKTLELETQIPTTLAKGEYDIFCHFHPAHVGSKLVVRTAESGTKN